MVGGDANLEAGCATSSKCFERDKPDKHNLRNSRAHMSTCLLWGAMDMQL